MPLGTVLDFPQDNLVEQKRGGGVALNLLCFLPVTSPLALLLKTTLLSSFLEWDPTDLIFAVGISRS